MKNKIFAFVAVLGFFFLSGCGSDTTVEPTPVDNSIKGNNTFVNKEVMPATMVGFVNNYPGTVRLRNGAPLIKITAESNIIDLLKFTPVGDTIEVGSDKLLAPTSIAFELYSSDYMKLVNNGTAVWTSDSLFCNPVITAKGPGNITLKGSSYSQKITSDSTAVINLEEMSTQHVVVVQKGRGSVKVAAKNSAYIYLYSAGEVTVTGIQGELFVEIVGSGTVYYKGSPYSVIQSISGSGKLVKLP